MKSTLLLVDGDTQNLRVLEVSLKNAGDYLGLSNVLCAGGSWVAPKDKVAAGDWDAIEALAAEAAALPR